MAHTRVSETRASIGILIGSTITFAIMYSPQPLISLYSRQYGVSPQTAGLAISLTTLALAISMMVVSVFADSWNRKRIMTLSLVATSLLTVCASFSRSFPTFLVFRFLEGISISCYPSIAMAYLHEEFPPERMGRIMGYYVAGTAVGGFTGRILIGVLTEFAGWHVAFLVLGVASLLGAGWFSARLPESRGFQAAALSPGRFWSGVRTTLRHRGLLSMFLIGFLLMGAYVTILNYIGYPLTRPPYNLSQSVFGFLFVVNLFGMWSSVAFGKLADRFPRRNILCLAVALFMAGVLLTLHGSLMMKVLGISATAAGFMAAHTVAGSWVGLLAPAACKGQASAFYLFFYYTGSSLVGWVGGVLVKRFDWNGIVLYVMGLLGIALAVLFLAGHSLHREPSVLRVQEETGP